MTTDDIPALPVYGFDPQSLSGLLSLAITVLLPILVGLLTKRSTSAGVKAILLLAFAAVKAFLEAWLQAANTSVDFAFVPVAISIVVNFAIAAVVHFGLFKPTGVSGAAQDTLVKDKPASPEYNG
jgi:hypothetical protein